MCAIAPSPQGHPYPQSHAAGPATCGAAPWAFSLASASCHPLPGLSPTAEAAVPAEAGEQGPSSLSVLLGSLRPKRWSGPSEPDPGVQAAY